MDENITLLEGEDLSAEDMAAIDTLNEEYSYYFLTEATNNTIRDWLIISKKVSNTEPVDANVPGDYNDNNLI